MIKFTWSKQVWNRVPPEKEKATTTKNLEKDVEEAIKSLLTIIIIMNMLRELK